MSAIGPFLLFLAAVAAAAFTGSRFQPDTWYELLRKPSWNPPNWLFAPVWTTLYVAIATAGWLVWKKVRSLSHPILLVWAAQLVLNAAWSWLFFGLHRPDLSLVDILLMLTLIAAFILTARKVSPAAAWLFVPYAAWVSFATALNVAIWQLNR